VCISKTDCYEHRFLGAIFETATYRPKRKVKRTTHTTIKHLCYEHFVEEFNKHFYLKTGQQAKGT
jgi:hypothetical protein